MIHIHRNVFVYPKRHANPATGSIQIRVRYEGKECTFCPKLTVEFSKWSDEMQCCKHNTTHGKKKVSSTQINRVINTYRDTIEDCIAEFERADRVPVQAEFKLAVNKALGLIKDNGSPAVVDCLDMFIREQGRLNQWSYTTFLKFRIIKERLVEYDNKLTFNSFTDSFLIGYVDFLRSEYDIRDSTLQRHLTKLRQFLDWACQRGYCTTREWQNFKLRYQQEKKAIVFLTWDELMRMYDLTIEDKALDRVRDVFCFCCFTSLRYSDVANLRRADIRDKSFTITTIKTRDRLTIELNSRAKAILQKYENEDFPEGRALPVISNQRANDYLKEVGRLAELNTPVPTTWYKGRERHYDCPAKWQVLTTHCGRRTFISNALMLGIPPNVVMKWTGHSDYKAMRPYIEIADKAKEDAMKLFDR